MSEKCKFCGATLGNADLEYGFCTEAIKWPNRKRTACCYESELLQLRLRMDELEEENGNICSANADEVLDAVSEVDVHYRAEIEKHEKLLNFILAMSCGNDKRVIYSKMRRLGIQTKEHKP